MIAINSLKTSETLIYSLTASALFFMMTVNTAHATTDKTLPVNTLVNSDLANLINQYATPENWQMLKGVVQQNVVNQDNDVKRYVHQVCKQELNRYKEWQLFSSVFSADIKQAYETQVCDCAMKETLYKTTPQDMLNLANPATRNQVIYDIGNHVVQVCSQSLMSNDSFHGD